MKISIKCLLNTLSFTRTTLRNVSHILLYDPLNNPTRLTNTIMWAKEGERFRQSNTVVTKLCPHHIPLCCSIF